MKKTALAALAACLMAFANPASAQVPNDVHAELNRLHGQLAENINNPDAGKRQCAATASKILNDLDWRARQAKEPDAWTQIYRTMDTYGACLHAIYRETNKRHVCNWERECQGRGTHNVSCKRVYKCGWVYPD